MPGEALNTAIDEPALAAAHGRMLASGEVQIDLPAYTPPEVPPWLRQLAEWLAQSGPVIKLLFWAGLAIIVLLVLWGLYGWLAPIIRARLGKAAPETAVELWTPDAAPARALLAEADALAAGGAYAEAAHLLLLRSVEQIEARFPGRLRPSWTSRDIKRVAMLPPDTARAFGLIADIVETGLFGRRAVNEAAWSQCRRAYEAAAFGPAA